MPRGGKRAGAGHPKGLPNRTTLRAIGSQLLAAIQAGEGPLDWLKGVYMGLVKFEQVVDGQIVKLAASPHERIGAAIAVASFTCPRPMAQPMALLTRQPSVNDHDGGDPEIPEFKRPN